MNLKSRAVPAALLLLAIAATALIWHHRHVFTTGELLRRLPTQNAIVLFVDFDALRRDGILQLLDNSKAGEDPEYQAFVRDTNFNYKRDLDSALAAFAPTGKFLLLRGRFDWKVLRAYLVAHGGACDADLCRVDGSTPERRISFFPLAFHVMAMAVSPDSSAALRLKAAAAAGPAGGLPEGPFWISVPVSALGSGDGLPDGTRAFARSLRQAETLTLAMVPEGRRLAAKMTVLCRNEADAADAASELTHVTALLRQMIESEHRKPNPNELAGVLTAGSFRPDGRRVLGYWPIERTFMESILGAGK